MMVRLLKLSAFSLFETKFRFIMFYVVIFVVVIFKSTLSSCLNLRQGIFLSIPITGEIKS